MKNFFYLVLMLLIVYSINIKAQTVSVQDSLALVTLYNSTGGPNWTHNDNWLSGNVDTWYGITVSNGNITEINLYNNHLSGVIPPEIGNLIHLTYLSISNNLISGEIPNQIGNLSNLTHLALYDNQLSGSIPAEIGNLFNLTILALNGNQLTGNIPIELGNLSQLTLIYLQNNQLTGNIPVEIGNLIDLQNLNLSNNQLNGNIPGEIGNLINLNRLNLHSNHLNGNIPSELGNLSNLAVLYLDYNEFNELPDLSSLTYNNLVVFLNNNNLDFGDLETAGIIAPHYTYAPQAKIGTEENHNVNIGDNLTLSIVTGGSNNTYQWYKDGSAISGATNNTLSLNNIQTTDAGVYTCEVRNAGFPDLTLTTENYNVNIGTGGVNDINKNEISIYPNPSSSYIILKSDIDINAIKIYNNSGQLVLKTAYKEKIDISKLSKGVYIVKIFGKDNKQLEVNKLIIK